MNTPTFYLEDLTEEELQIEMEKEDIQAKANGTYETYYEDEFGQLVKSTN